MPESEHLTRDAVERCVMEDLLPSLSLGQVVRVVPSGYCLFAMTQFTPEAVQGLWVRLVLALTDAHMVNGIPDVPMVWQDRYAVIWVDRFQIICLPNRHPCPRRACCAARPLLPPSLTLAIGGPAGSGKTTLIHRLLASAIGERVRRYTVYTTRPRRGDETEAVDYHFVQPMEIESYRNDLRFTGFVEARGYWYWIDPSEFFRAYWSQHHAIHVFVITQTHEFLARQRLVPDVRWIWLDASPPVLRQRLEARDGKYVDRSLAQNARLEAQDRAGLMSLQISTETQDADDVFQKLLDYIYVEEKRP